MSSATWKVVQRIPHNGDVQTLALSPDVALVAFGFGGILVVWDLRQNMEVARFQATNEKALCCAAFSPDGAVLATGLRGGYVHLRRVGAWKGTPTQIDLGEGIVRLSSGRNAIQHLAFSSSPGHLTALNEDRVGIIQYGKGLFGGLTASTRSRLPFKTAMPEEMGRWLYARYYPETGLLVTQSSEANQSMLRSWKRSWFGLKLVQESQLSKEETRFYEDTNNLWNTPEWLEYPNWFASISADRQWFTVITNQGSRATGDDYHLKQIAYTAPARGGLNVIADTRLRNWTTQAAISSDGSTVAAACKDQGITIFRLADG